MFSSPQPERFPARLIYIDLNQEERLKYSGGTRGGQGGGGKCPTKLFYAPPFCPPPVLDNSVETIRR